MYCVSAALPNPPAVNDFFEAALVESAFTKKRERGRLYLEWRAHRHINGSRSVSAERYDLSLLTR